MIRLEVIEKISKYFRLTQFEAEKVYEEIFSLIAQGVKEDSIIDIANFGEFIIKYNNGKNDGDGNSFIDNYKKTVEFLASSSLEAEIGGRSRENTSMSNITGISDSTERTANTGEYSSGSVEEELRKKREALLNRISIHPLQDASQERKMHETDTNVVIPPPIVAPEILEQEKEIPQQEVTPLTGETEEVSETTADSVPGAGEKSDETLLEPEEDISKKSFSDYFSEVNDTNRPLEQTSQVLPKSAIDLHNEITGTAKDELVAEPINFQPERPLESKIEDKSYYIWYKDSESSPADTQNLSYEYELLYQATKEAEYKSKLKIYVSTFIIFFSIVLILLIFSPLIYKVFFTPIELQNTDILGEKNVNQTSEVPDQSASQNVVQETSSQDINKTQPDTGSKTSIPPVSQQQSGPPPQKVEEQKPEQNPPPVQQKVEEPRIEGITENSIGWTDGKFKVVYAKLDNGKIAIQESSWDLEAKANRRITQIESYKIAGLKGSVAKVDVSGKGSWYRVRLGEFSTLQEARSKAEELRKKVGN